MVAKAELVLEGNTYLLNSVTIEIEQIADQFGRPSTAAKGGKIEIELFSVEDDVIFDWMVHTKKTLNGSINLYEADFETKLKEIKFEDGYCIEFSEHFEEAADNSLVTRFKISAEKLSIGNIDLDNQWLK
jgi:hypothetical protein